MRNSCPATTEPPELGGGADSRHESGFSVERDLKATVVLEVFCRKLGKGGTNSIEMRG